MTKHKIKGAIGMEIAADHIAQAMTETDWHRRQVQCFCYPIEPDMERHIIRDLTKKPGEQTVWQETVKRHESHIASDMQFCAADDYKNEIIAKALTRILGDE